MIFGPLYIRGAEVGGAAGTTPVPVFLDSTQSRWVTPFQTAGPESLAAGTDIWVKPFTVTTP